MTTERARNAGSLRRLLVAAAALGPRDWEVSEIAEAAGVELKAARSLINETARRGDGRIISTHRGGGRPGDISRFQLGESVPSADVYACAKTLLLRLLAAQYRDGVRLINQIRLGELVRADDPTMSPESIKSAMRRLTASGRFIRSVGTTPAIVAGGTKRLVTQWALLAPLVGQAEQRARRGAAVTQDQAWQRLVAGCAVRGRKKPWAGVPWLRDCVPRPQPDPKVVPVHSEDEDDAPAMVYEALAALARHNARVDQARLKMGRGKHG